MDDHLGYEKSERSDNDDYRNGYKRKQVNSRYGSMEIEGKRLNFRYDRKNPRLLSSSRSTLTIHI